MIYYTKKDIDKISKDLLDGKVLALPTETVYGLGVISSNYDSFLRLKKIKDRDLNKPFTLMISNINQVKDLIEINDLTKNIISKFTPGELTLILKTRKDKIIPSHLDLNSGFIGIRIPKSKFLLDLITKINEPILVPSANPKGLKPAKNYLEVYNYFKEDIDAIVKGEIVSNVPSTIIKINGDKIELIREGNIKLEDILKEIK